MEDNLTKAKRALMTPKQFCPTGVVVQEMENKANPGEQDAKKLAKLKETWIKKTSLTPPLIESHPTTDSVSPHH